MNIKTNQPAERRALFRSLYEQAKNSFSEQLAAFDRHMAQYRGSTELDGSHEAASTVRNITYEIIESQISSTIPDPKVDAISYSERRDRCAKAIEQLCRGLRSRLPFEELNDLDERYTYILGGSVWLLEWDDRLRDHGERGGIRIRCLSPRDFIPQPAIDRIEDMDYCFLRFTATRAELCRTYGISQEAIAQAAVEPDADLSLADGECATVIVCFYRDEEGEIGQFVFSGELTLEKTFTLAEGDTARVLSFEKYGVNAVRVSVNGRDVDTILWAPYTVDLTPYLQAGENTVRLTLVNNLRNLLGPHHHVEGELLAVGPGSFYNEPCIWNGYCGGYYTDKYSFVHTGLKNCD